MTYNAIIDEMNKGVYQSIYFLQGEEPYFIDVLTEHVSKNALDESQKAFNQIVLYGKDIDANDVIDNARQFPMMSERKVVIVKEAQSMKNIADLKLYIDSPATHTILVLAHKNKKLDMRTAFAKSLTKNAVVFDSKKIYDNKIPQWVTSYVKTKNKSIDVKATYLLAEFVGSDLNILSGEIDKLLISLDQESISESMVYDMVGVSKEYNVFELNKALGMRNETKSFAIIHYMSRNEKSNPLVMVIANIYSYFAKLAVLRGSKSRSEAEQLKLMGLSPRASFFLKEYKQAAANFKIDQLKKIFSSLAKADRQSKGLGQRHLSNEDVLNELAFNILQ